MKTIRILALFIFLFVGVAVLMPSDMVMAQAQQVQQGVNAIGGENAASLTVTIKDLINVFLYIIGALSVIMIIYGGFRYVTSGGDSSSVSAAKNTILYAVIGLVIALSAYTIVNFVVDAVGSSADSDPNGCNGTADPARTECQ